MKKFKKKRRLSTDLHARWGDVAISHPTQGSWNQWDQPSGFVANTPEVESSSQYESGQRYSSVGSFREPSPTSSIRRSRSTGPPERSMNASPSFPTGHFNHNIRHRDAHAARPSPFQGLGIGDLRRDSSHNASGSVINDDSSSSCCDEDEEDRDGPAPVGFSPRIYEMADTSQAPRDHTDDFDIPAKSPPLAVTSRMRHDSIHSYATDPVASVSAGAAHSPRTSYTAGSSVSAPLMPSGTPRHGLPGHPKSKLEAYSDKRHHRPRPPNSESTVRQEMVPSYDDLYG
ncbi:hypothetical protein MYU51_011555 [Penicillium brevicompactum]